ncbi:MAG TPA: carboxypeptidase regulatory-like domain-containing protein [Vicinamibacterales bacterium]|nr:carboxypeptidase regulatory-like domain-containing protein [Vicinamibacterales bacterium]
MRIAGLCIAIWAVMAAPALAQIGAGTLTGDVIDQAGAVVSGATVTVSSVRTNATRSQVTGRDGNYAFGGLLPGAYRVRVELSGFRPLILESIQIATGETVRLDLHLTVGGVAEAVTVAADAPLLRGETSALGHVIDNKRIVGLPLNGRSFISLASLVPGVALPPPPAAPFPRINGGRPRTNEYLFDGISVLQPEPGQVAFFPNIDAIQEFKIESNSARAEFGRFNGGVVNLTTKSGGNVFQGSLFEFFRHETLNARNVFASTNPIKPRFRRNQFGGVAGGPIRQNATFFFVDYQGQRQAIGRTVISTVPTLLQRQGIFTEPIGTHVPVIYDPATTRSTGVGVATRTQFPGNTIPVERMDAVARALLDRYPLPTSGGTVNNYRRTENESVDQDQFSLRIDHRRANDRDRVFGRLTRFREAFMPVTPLPDGSGVTLGTLGPQNTESQSFASNYQRTFSNNVVNELRVGDTRRTVTRAAARLSGKASTTLGLPGIPSGARFPNTLPTFLIGGYQQIGSPQNTASDFGTSVTQIADSLTWLKGRHTIKMGADLRWERLNVIQPPSPTGQFTFSNLFSNLPTDTTTASGTGTPLASFLLGQVQQFFIDLQQDEIRNRAHFQEYFIQDDWRISDRVTVNGGLRYTLNFPSTEENDQVAVFNLDTGQLDYLGGNGQPRAARRLHTNNFGPRLGVVGRITPRTVVRTAYGLVWIEMAGLTTPFTTPAFPFLQTVSQRTLDNIAPAFRLASGPSVEPIPLTPNAGLGQGVFAVDRNLGSGYVQQWNMSLQRELNSDMSVEVAYAGSKITHVGIPDTNLNQLTVEQLAQGASLLQRVPNPYAGVVPQSSSLGDPTIPLAQLLKPYPQYTTVSLYRNNVGTTIYHGVYAKLEQRFSRQLSYLLSYTRSKLVDDASSVFDASILTGPVANVPVADSFNRKLERDYSTGDIPHVFVASAIWEIPWGTNRRNQSGGVLGRIFNDWTLTGVLTLQSGVPLAIAQTTNNNAFAGFGTQRPNLVGDPTLPADERSVGRWFNTSAFVAAPQFTIGTSSRNPVRGPGYRNLDMALIRRVPLRANRALEVRAEMFNATNTPPFGAPNTTVGAAAFGTITSAGDSRVVQFGLKLMF